MLHLSETGLEGLKILVPQRFGDNRGYFLETWNARAMRDVGLDIDFVQDNRSLSVTRYTLRGLHAQRPPHAQTKLVSCTRGRLLDVAVDIRSGSPSFGEHFMVELSEDNGKQLLIPHGFLHGFVTLTENTVISYKCSDFYNRGSEISVRYDDPDLAINWRLGDTAPVLSKNDETAGAFTDVDGIFGFEAETA